MILKALHYSIRDIGYMARVITIPHVTISTLSAYILHAINPLNVHFEIIEVYNFTISSFPLTIASVIIFYRIERDRGNIFEFSFILVAMAILSGYLHKWVTGIPIITGVPDPPLPASDTPVNNSANSAPLPVLAYYYLVAYFKQFGWLMFIQAIIVGAIAGTGIAKWVKGKEE